MSDTAKNLSNGWRELIAFRIGDQEFCVDIMCVREIRGWTKTTPLPHAPDYVIGVINLRGSVLPIMDLGARLGFKPTEASARHVIIVVQIGSQTVGLLVDAVSDILTVNSEDIQPPPELPSDMEQRSGYARGILAIEKRMICLIELDVLVDATESMAA